MGETPCGVPKLLNELGELVRFGAFVAPELGPGVIGNGLPDPAFMPMRDAVRAGSSAVPGGNPFGHVLLFGAEFEGLEPAAELFGVIAGGEPAGGQFGIVSNGEPAPVVGIAPRIAFGVGSYPSAGRCPSGVACHGVELGTFAFGCGPMTIGALEFGGAEVGAPFQRFAPFGCE